MNIALQHSELSAHSCVRERYITWHARLELDAVCVSSGVSGVGRLVVLVVCVCVPREWSRECGHTEWSVRFGGLKVDKLDRMVAKIDKRQTETLSYILLWRKWFIRE